MTKPSDTTHPNRGAFPPGEALVASGRTFRKA